MTREQITTAVLAACVFLAATGMALLTLHDWLGTGPLGATLAIGGLVAGIVVYSIEERGDRHD